jgi:hypothetical protein
MGYRFSPIPMEKGKAAARLLVIARKGRDASLAKMAPRKQS